MRQIGLALLMYAEKHEGKFPASFDVLVTDPDLELSSELFVCPASDLTRAVGPTTQATAQIMLNDPGHVSYTYLGAGMSNTAGKDAVLAYEPEEDHRRDGINVLYADGHVEWIPKPQYAVLLDELKSGRNPPAANYQGK